MASPYYLTMSQLTHLQAKRRKYKGSKGHRDSNQRVCPYMPMPFVWTPEKRLLFSVLVHSILCCRDGHKLEKYEQMDLDDFYIELTDKYSMLSWISEELNISKELIIKCVKHVLANREAFYLHTNIERAA